MKLTKLYKELTNKNMDRLSSLNEVYKNKVQSKASLLKGDMNNANGKHLVALTSSDTNNNILNTVLNESLDNLKIIGITGSKGKSTVAYLTHKYLESLGKKSMLYSSVAIDSKSSNKKMNEACESALPNESIILEILEEASAYEAEYLVLEINESAIASGIVLDIPFNVRALTNIDKYNSEEFMDLNSYVETKKSFFRNIPVEDNCISIFGMTNHFTREEFNELLDLSANETITYGSKYVCERYNADYRNIDYLLIPTEGKRLDTLEGLNFTVKTPTSNLNIETSIISPHNALNITLVAAILGALNILNQGVFVEFLRNINIPGRNEMININGRRIIIGMSLTPTLEDLKRYKELGDINSIKVVMGSAGVGFHTWDEKFQSTRRVSILPSHRSYAMNEVAKHADYVYLTSNDPADSNPYAIAMELSTYLNNRIASKIIVDRKSAIKEAILESNVSDVIFIAGRGNRRYFCKNATEIELFTDLEVVLEVIQELGW